MPDKKEKIPDLNKVDDYHDGLIISEEENKPIFLWFTGFGCGGNQKDQEVILSSPAIIKQLNEEFIPVMLFVDDRTKLPEIKSTKRDGREIKIRTIGNRWANLQIEKYHCYRQPYITIIDAKENSVLDYDDNEISETLILSFLKAGRKAYHSASYLPERLSIPQRN